MGAGAERFPRSRWAPGSGLPDVPLIPRGLSGASTLCLYFWPDALSVATFSWLRTQVSDWIHVHTASPRAENLLTRHRENRRPAAVDTSAEY